MITGGRIFEDSVLCSSPPQANMRSNWCQSHQLNCKTEPEDLLRSVQLFDKKHCSLVENHFGATYEKRGKLSG